MRQFFLFSLFSILLLSCHSDSKNIVDVSGIEMNVAVMRFDMDFYQSNGENLEDLKLVYPELFPKNTPDSIWLAKMKDPDEQELFRETTKAYKDFFKTREELTELFKYVKYYNQDFLAPKVVTILTNIDYAYKVVYSGPLLFISLDVYLGKNHKFYADFPEYIKENNIQERIVIDVATKLIEKQVKPTSNRSFLGKMIATGKKMYLLDLYLPLKEDRFKIGYSIDKYNWALANESEVWRYFIENNLLYSSDTKLNKRFLDEAPFSKFYLSEDAKSPGRIGEWIGWQIVRAFMEKNDVSLQALIKMTEEEIFEKSNYKPKK